MNIADMSPEQQAAKREYNKLHKRKSRANQKASSVLSKDEAFDEFPEEQTRILNEQVTSVTQQVRTELALDKLGYQDEQNIEYGIDLVSRSVLALKKNWTQQTHEGVYVGGTYLADAIAPVAISIAQKYRLESSPTFGELYRELLQLLEVRKQDKDA